MRFSRHQLLALVLGAGMASALPAQTPPTRAGRAGMDSARMAKRAAAGRGGMDSTRMAMRAAGGRPGLDSTRMANMMALRAEGGGSPAAIILSQREKLGLTDDQVNRLETLKSAPLKGELPAADMAKLRTDLAEASKGEANITAARAALDKINAATTSALIGRLEAHNQARAVLNADQQAQFDAAESRRPMAGAMMMGGGRGGRGGAPPDAAKRPVRKMPPPPPPNPPAAN